MRQLHAWLAREAERQRSNPRLEHALLTDHTLGYVVYRLKYMWLRVLIRCAVHVLEIMLLSATIPSDWLALFIGYRTSSGLLSSLYWGVLEQLRQTVRGHVRRHQFGSARLAIHNWLRLSVVLGVLALGAVSVWIATAPSEFKGFSVFDLFGLVCFGRLAFDLWARTLHSGIFATRRVYRPLWSIVVPDLVEIGALILLFPPYGLFAFVAMIVVGGAVRIGLANHFSKRAYRTSRVAVPTVREAITARNALSWATLREGAKQGVSNATSQLDGLMIMLLLFAGGDDAGGATFAGVYYVLRPLMGVAHGWARAFYFDFQRLDGQVQLFRRRFRRLMAGTAVGLAAVVVVLVLGATALLSRGNPPVALWWLAPFFVARSLMSLRQLDAFVSGQHVSLLRVSLGLLCALGAIAWLMRDELVVMVSATLLMLLAYRLLTPKERARSVGSVTGLPRWLSMVRSEPGEVRLSVLTVDRTLTTPSRLIRRLVPLTADGALFTRFGRSHVLVSEPADSALFVSGAAAAVSGDGAVVSYRSATGMTGASALLEARASMLPPELVRVLDSAPEMDLTEAFQRLHPLGVVLDAEAGRVRAGKSLGVRELRAVVAAIATQGRGGTTRSLHGFDVLVYAPGGEPETIFVTPRTDRPTAEFRHRVQAATLRASLRDSRSAGVAQRRP